MVADERRELARALEHGAHAAEARHAFGLVTDGEAQLEEGLETWEVLLQVRRELEEDGAKTRPERLQRVEEISRLLTGILEPLEVGDPTRRLVFLTCGAALAEVRTGALPVSKPQL